MSSPSRKAKFLNLLIVPWVVTWVLIVPLFHIHTLDIQETSPGFRHFYHIQSLAQTSRVSTPFGPPLVRVEDRGINTLSPAISYSTQRWLSFYSVKMMIRSGSSEFRPFTMRIFPLEYTLQHMLSDLRFLKSNRPPSYYCNRLVPHAPLHPSPSSFLQNPSLR